MSRQRQAGAERVVIGLMILGMVGMFQPFTILLYRPGFLLLLVSTIVFIVLSHLTPVPETPDASAAGALDPAAELLHSQHERGDSSGGA